MKSKIYDAIYVIIHTFEDGGKKGDKVWLVDFTIQ